MKSASNRCYCAFCRSERTVYLKRHVGFTDIFLAFAASALMSFIVWQDFDPRLLIFFVLAVGLAELFIVFRRRLSLVCTRCGFDPIIYRRDPNAAARRVKAHYKTRMEDPGWVMSPPPKLPMLFRKTDHSKDSPKDQSAGR